MGSAWRVLGSVVSGCLKPPIPIESHEQYSPGVENRIAPSLTHFQATSTADRRRRRYRKTKKTRSCCQVAGGLIESRSSGQKR